MRDRLPGLPTCPFQGALGRDLGSCPWRGSIKQTAGLCWPQAWVILSMGGQALPHLSRGLDRQLLKMLVATPQGSRNRGPDSLTAAELQGQSVFTEMCRLDPYMR